MSRRSPKHLNQSKCLCLIKSMKRKIKVSIIGCGNVGVAIAADLAIRGHDVTIVKTSRTNESLFDKIKANGNRILLKEDGTYKTGVVGCLTHDFSNIAGADVVILTIQSTYHEQVIEKMSKYLYSDQIVVVVCSYMSSFYFDKYCKSKPVIAETTGPYLEGRIEDNDKEVVFRVGCRLTRSPLSVYPARRADMCMRRLNRLYMGFSDDYCVIESGLLNPNMILHTVGSVMSIPRIEYSDGDFCMYREAYARKNNATLHIMLSLDDEKKKVLRELGCKPIDIFVAGGFLGNPIESFYNYSESSDRAISPTSVRSRYIMEDVGQGLVLLESTAKLIGVEVPVASSLINIASAALDCDFRATGRTLQRLGADGYVDLYRRT